MKTAAVVTVTNGKRPKELKQCVDSVFDQTYPITHYILCDGDLDTFLAIKKEYPLARVCYWDNQIGGNGYAGQRWLAAAPQLVVEDVTFFCNDDDWYDPDHVKTIMDAIYLGFDWAYSFRSIYDQDGNFVCDDCCEALGEVHEVWNMPNHHFVDWCMWGMKTERLRQLAVVLNRPDPSVDRLFYHAAKSLAPEFVATGKHTFNFRLGGSCGVQKEFFEQGNKAMLEKYNGVLPWIST